MRKTLLIALLFTVIAVAVPVRVVNVSHDKSELNTRIAPKLQRMKQIADTKLPEWKSLSYEQKRQIIKNERYPLVNLMWSIYKYLHKNWFGEVVENGEL